MNEYYPLMRLLFVWSQITYYRCSHSSYTFKTNTENAAFVYTFVELKLLKTAMI